MYKRYIDNIDLFKDFNTFGEFDTPVIRKTSKIDVKTEFIPFNFATTYKGERKDVGVHFFIDDYQFERIWRRPLIYVEFLKQFKYILSPDFSLYTDYPKAYQIYNDFRKQAFAALAQSAGVKVIPSISWSDKTSYNFAFDGVERNSIVAVSSVGSMNDDLSKEMFVKGFKQMIDILNPIQIIFFGILPTELECYTDIIIFKNSFQEKFRNKDVV